MESKPRLADLLKLTIVRVPLVMIALSAFIITAMVVAGKAYFRPSLTPSPAPATVRTPIPDEERIQVEAITLRQFGFEPREITRAKGQVLLAVENRSGLEAMHLQLDKVRAGVERVKGGRIDEAHVPRESRDWHELFDLQPGEYTLTEANHPEWVCHITVTD